MAEVFRRLLLAFLALSCAGAARAAVFNDVLPGARANAMGMAYTALADEPFGMFYNPAGLAGISFPELSGGAARAVSPAGLMYHHTVVYARPFPVLPGSTVGAGLFRIRQRNQGDKTSLVTHFSHSIKLPQFYIKKPIRVGANVKIVQVAPPNKPNKVAPGIDAGAQLDVGWGIRTGLSVTDLTPDLGVSNPSLNLGLAYRLKRRATLAGDLRVRPGLTQFLPGVEIDFFQRLMRLRVGKGLPLDGVGTVALGIGVNYSPITIDFGMSVPWRGMTHRGGGAEVSLSYKFGAPAFYGRFVGSAAREAEDLRSKILELESRKKDMESETAAAAAEKTSLEGRAVAEEDRLRDLQEQVREIEAELDRRRYEAGHPEFEEEPEPPPQAPVPPKKPVRRKPKPARFPLRHKVRPGDTLRKLADKYYGDPALWERIYEANPDKIERGLPIEGSVLRVPAPGRRGR